MPIRVGRSIKWECVCDCGETVYPTSSRLVSGRAFSCRLCKLYDLSGKRFGNLIAKKRLNKTKQSCRVWECQCDCGKIVEVKSAFLKNGTTKSCGCRRIMYKDPTIRAKKMIYSSYKISAKKKGLNFNIDFEDFLRLISSNCHYCDSIPKNVKRDGKIIKTEFIYNGIDRMDNKQGYSLGNCVPCCSFCNKAKKNLSLREFLSWGTRLYQRSGKW